MKEVNSSNIKAIGYNLETKTLFVEFKAGGTYQYSEVAKETYEAFEKSESIGKFHNLFIKGKYQFIKAVV